MIPYSVRAPENVPFSVEIYIILLYFIYPLKFLMVWPMLCTALIKDRVRNIIVWTRILFVINVLISSLCFYLLGYGLGIFDRVYNFFLKTSSEQILQYLPGWVHYILALSTSSVLGLFISWLAMGYSFDGVKWLLSRIPKFFVSASDFIKRKFQAPQISTIEGREQK